MAGETLIYNKTAPPGFLSLLPARGGSDLCAIFCRVGLSAVSLDLPPAALIEEFNIISNFY
jgi:hypothetical protein